MKTLTTEKIISRAKFTLLCFVIGFVFPFFLKIFDFLISDSETGIQIKEFFVGVFTFGIFIFGAIFAVGSSFFESPLGPSFYGNVLFIGGTNGIFFSLIGYCLWKGIYQNKTWIIYSIISFFLLLVASWFLVVQEDPVVFPVS